MPSAPQMQRSGFCEERRRRLFEAPGEGDEHEQQHEVEKRGGHHADVNTGWTPARTGRRSAGCTTGPASREML